MFISRSFIFLLVGKLHPFLCNCNIPLCVCMCVYLMSSLSVHLLMDSICFHVLAIVYNADVIFVGHVFFSNSCFYFLQYIIKNGIV